MADMLRAFRYFRFPTSSEAFTITSPALRLQPRPASFLQAAGLYHGGQLDECLEAVQGASDHSMILLGVRCLMRSGQFSEAERAIETYWSHGRTNATDRQRGEMSTVRASVAARLGNKLKAISAFGEARGYLYSCPHEDELLADLEIAQALFALSDDDYELSEHCAMAAEAIGNFRQRIVARDVLSFVCAARNDFRSQLELQERNFNALRDSKDENYLLACIVKNVAVLAQQQDRIDLFEPLRCCAERLVFHSGMKHLESETFRDLGVSSSRMGDHLTAFRYLRRSHEAAQTPFQKLCAILDGATVSREINESTASADRVIQATELSALVHWETASIAQRTTLFLLSEEQARVDVSLARATLEMAHRLNSPTIDELGSIASNRFRAMLTHARGVLAKVELDTESATVHLQAAFRYWCQIGLGWEAATAAMHLIELTNADEYREFCERYCSRTNSAHLRRQLQHVTQKNTVLAS